MSVLLSLVSNISLAGDPCPIDYSFHNLGVIQTGNQSPLAKLKSHASWIGITYRSPHEGETESESGVIISGLPKNSPAREAGIREGDVLIGIGGNTVSDIASVDVILEDTSPNEPLVFKIVRDSKTQSFAVQPQLYDPLLRQLFVVNDAEDECANTRLDDSLSEQSKNALRQHVLSPKPSFYCKDAHQRILNHPDIHEGDIVFIRGTWRVLMSVAGFNTLCVKSADYDGEKLTNTRVKKLFEVLTAEYTNNRHENP